MAVTSTLEQEAVTTERFKTNYETTRFVTRQESLNQLGLRCSWLSLKGHPSELYASSDTFHKGPGHHMCSPNRLVKVFCICFLRARPFVYIPVLYVPPTRPFKGFGPGSLKQRMLTTVHRGPSAGSNRKLLELPVLSLKSDNRGLSALVSGLVV